MCSSVAPRLWFLTDRRIREDYPQQEILRALKAKCCEEELDFRALVMDEVVLTIEDGNLGLRVNGELVTAYPQVVVVRVPTPWVQSDSDITVLRHLEKMGCRLMNRPQAILNCVNKFWTFQELAGHGVPLPDTFSYGGHENFAKMIDEAEVLEFPMVVKNTRGHRGKAVFLARDKHHLADLSHLIRHDAPYLFQKYVKESHGKDVRVIVVGGRVVGTMLRCSTDGRMQSNCSLGGVGMMCSLSEQGKQLAVQVSNILGMDVCGIDLLMKDDGSFYVCEANANDFLLSVARPSLHHHPWPSVGTGELSEHCSGPGAGAVVETCIIPSDCDRGSFGHVLPWKIMVVKGAGSAVTEIEALCPQDRFREAARDLPARNLSLLPER
ncbi:beta-citrylglutamate synthase B isoform X2 [Alligator mississippiensis]|uniref:beta-citrylglutamate synthase B isoform X2 n=1 Tax=Alligator mississippiensis TaxID=8496 RepID=UPI0009075843|nr:beta-citrylglutamate synthase B isoform X2 [Alligator mississippiensis]